MAKLKLPSLYEAVYGMPGSYDGRYGYGSKLGRDPGLGDNLGKQRPDYSYINMYDLNPEEPYELTDDEAEVAEDIFHKTRGEEYASGNPLHPNDYSYMPSYNAISEHTNPVRPVATPYSNFSVKPSETSQGQGPTGLTTGHGEQKTGTQYGTSRAPKPHINDKDPDDLTYNFSIDSFAMDKDEHASLAFKKQQKILQKYHNSIKKR